MDNTDRLLVVDEIVAGITKLHERAEQAEALVGRLQEELRRRHSHEVLGHAWCEACALLADPTGARLAEEQRALESCYQAAKELELVDKHEDPTCACRICVAVAAVERARSR